MRRYWLSILICVLAAVFYCYEYILRIAPNAMSAELMVAFGISAASLGHLSAFYYHAYSPMQLPVGVVFDRFGPRKVLFVAVLMCAFGTIMFASNSYYAACSGRFLVGLGSAFAFVGVLKLTSIWLPSKYFALVTGLTTSLGMLGAMAGNILIADFVSAIGWKQTLYWGAGFGMLLAPIMLFVIRDKTPKDHPMSKQSSEDEQEITLSELIKHCSKIVMKPQVILAGIAGFLFYLPTSVFAELFGPTYLSSAHDLDSYQSVSASAMIFLGWAIGGPLAGFISDTIERRKILLQIGSIGALVLFSILLYGPKMSYGSICILMIFFGIFSSVEVLVFAIGKENCKESLSGTAVAVVNLIVMLGGVFFQPIVGAILDWYGAYSFIDGVPQYSDLSYKVALSVLPVGLLLCFFLSTFFMKETNCKQLES